MKRTIMVLTFIAGTVFLPNPAMADDAPDEVAVATVSDAPKTETPVEPEVTPEPVKVTPEPVKVKPEPEKVTPEKVKPKKVTPEPEKVVKSEPFTDHKESVCHPVNGKGELGNGWNLIPPAQASLHLDEEGNAKHHSKDGLRHDMLAVDGMCPGGPIEDNPEVVEFPSPDSLDPCGLDNASWVKPADSDEVYWTVSDAGYLTGHTNEGYVWPNNTTSNGWGAPPESSVLCIEVPFPTSEVTDPCGLDNASWVKPDDSNEVSWTIGDAGQLTGETKTGYVWPNGTTINGWGTPKDSSVLCVVETPAFDEYETTVCWRMDKSDGVEGTYEWPQTRVSCDFPTPKCEMFDEYQIDTYWVRDQSDEDYLASLKVLNSPADDARLEPHDYSSKLLRGAEKCEVVVPPTEPPVVVVPPTEPPVVVVPPTEPPVVVVVVVTPEPKPEIGTPVSLVSKTPVADEATASLPATGGPSMWLGITGIFLLIAGAVTVIGNSRIVRNKK